MKGLANYSFESSDDEDGDDPKTKEAKKKLKEMMQEEVANHNIGVSRRLLPLVCLGKCNKRYRNRNLAAIANMT